jgi:hypothetical protein
MGAVLVKNLLEGRRPEEGHAPEAGARLVGEPPADGESLIFVRGVKGRARTPAGFGQVEIPDVAVTPLVEKSASIELDSLHRGPPSGGDLAQFRHSRLSCPVRR